MTITSLEPQHRFARSVHPSNGQGHAGIMGAELLHDIAAGLSAWASSISESVPGDPAMRRYARLLETPAYEAWLIVWPRETGLELHDHGDSSGVLRVLRGELVEAFTDREERGPLRVQRLAPGDSVTLGPTRVHDVWNPAATTALSVHVYSPPLSSMTYYEDRPFGPVGSRRWSSVSEARRAASATILADARTLPASRE